MRDEEEAAGVEGKVRGGGTVRWRVQQRAEGWIQSGSVPFGSKQTAMLVESIEKRWMKGIWNAG